MALIRVRRKRSQASTPSPSRLHALSDGDLFLFVEASLMNAQRELSEYQRGEHGLRLAHLDLLTAELRAVTLGVQELQDRSV